jgi:hypothetical protein
LKSNRHELLPGFGESRFLIPSSKTWPVRGLLPCVWVMQYANSKIRMRQLCDEFFPVEPRAQRKPPAP